MSKTDKPLLVGNWKMNPVSLKEAKSLSKNIIKLSSSIRNTDIVICPPDVYIEAIKGGYRGKKVQFGGQNIYFESSGSHTGETSPKQLADLGLSHVILGHSERRRPLVEGGQGETSLLVSRKVQAALLQNLVPIVCIGEEERSRDGHYLHFIHDQIKESFTDISVRNMAKVIIAYEPVWAIGGGASSAITGHDLHEMMLYIRKVLTQIWGKPIANKVKILYGGSVKPGNAHDLSREGNMDGFLVGGASLNAEDFISIAKLM